MSKQIYDPVELMKMSIEQRRRIMDQEFERDRLLEALGVAVEALDTIGFDQGGNPLNDVAGNIAKEALARVEDILK